MEPDSRVKDALERWKFCNEEERKWREPALDDARFFTGGEEQWPQAILSKRKANNKPCLTINRLPGQVHQVTNAQRQNRQAILIHPVDDTSDIQTAEIWQGIVRHIEYDSSADVAYDTAYEWAVMAGIGYFVIRTEFEYPESFDQCLKIDRVRNPFRCYLDPNYEKPDGSDTEYGFLVSDLQNDDYKRQYPHSELAGLDDMQSIGDCPPGWMDGDNIRIAEYWYKEYRSDKLLLVKNRAGEMRPILKSDLEKVFPKGLPKGAIVARERDTRIPSVKHCKINAVEILEETDWLSQYIPLIPVLGEEIEIDGERMLKGLVRDAKDPQRRYNYFATKETEAIALAPVMPWVIAKGQDEGFEQEYKQANSGDIVAVHYNAVTAAGEVVGAPQRSVQEPAIQAITMAALHAVDDLKATTGIYDAQIGRQSNETSGRAINARKVQGETSNLHYADNLRRSRRHAGRIILEIGPKIYTGARVMRIIGEDQTASTVKVNQPTTYKGQPVTFDLSLGKFDAVVDDGPSYNTKREQSAEMMMALISSVPEIFPRIADLAVKALDIPGSQEMAKRLIPEDVAQEGEQAIPPQVKQKLDQQGQMIEMLTQQLNAAKDLLANKKLELDSKERMNTQDNQTALAVAELKADIEGFKAEVGHLHKQLDLVVAQQDREQQAELEQERMGHEAMMADQQNQLQRETTQV